MLLHITVSFLALVSPGQPAGDRKCLDWFRSSMFAHARVQQPGVMLVFRWAGGWVGCPPGMGASKQWVLVTAEGTTGTRAKCRNEG